MEAKFTKGEWESEYVGVCHAVFSGDKEVCCLSNGKDLQYDESKANSNLIAAAPEMYELLSDAADSLYQSNVEGDINLAGEIRDLLAKARGE